VIYFSFLSGRGHSCVGCTRDGTGQLSCAGRPRSSLRTGSCRFGGSGRGVGFFSSDIEIPSFLWRQPAIVDVDFPYHLLFKPLDLPLIFKRLFFSKLFEFGSAMLKDGIIFIIQVPCGGYVFD
jgi:hypothetical protein